MVMRSIIAVVRVAITNISIVNIAGIVAAKYLHSTNSRCSLVVAVAAAQLRLVAVVPLGSLSSLDGIHRSS